MFEKIIVSALTTSESIGSLNTYTRKLQKQQRIRGIIFVLALMLLLLQYASPALLSSQNSGSNDADIIYGGVSSKEDLFTIYSAKISPLRSLTHKLGISEQNIRDLSQKPPASFEQNNYVVWSTTPTSQTELYTENYKSAVFTTTSDKIVYYAHPLSLQMVDRKPQALLFGQSSKIGDFAIMKESGNIITSWQAGQQASLCYKTPDRSLSYTHCPNSTDFKTSISIHNASYKTDAAFLKTKPGSKLAYTLTATNMYSEPAQLTPQVYVGDILEYANLEETPGGIFDKRTETIEWPRVTIPPQKSASYTFSVITAKHTPLTPRGTNNTASYDCQLSIFFGYEASSKITCPPPKVIERLLIQPQSQSFLLLAWIGAGLSLFLYLHAKLLHRQVTLILRELRKQG